MIVAMEAVGRGRSSGESGYIYVSGLWPEVLFPFSLAPVLSWILCESSPTALL